MATYRYKCLKCNITKDIELAMSDVGKEPILCDKCKQPMKRDYQANFIIPDYMKGDNIQQMGWLKDIMKNKPSGKRKVIY